MVEIDVPRVSSSLQLVKFVSRRMEILVIINFKVLFTTQVTKEVIIRRYHQMAFCCKILNILGCCLYWNWQYQASLSIHEYVVL